MNLDNLKFRRGLLAAAGIAAVALRLVFFTGLQGADDLVYSDTAYRLTQGEGLPRGNILGLRLGIVGPVAALYALFGVHIFWLVLPVLAGSLLMVWVSYRLAAETVSEPAGVVAAWLAAVFPLNLHYATLAHADLPMAAVASASLLLFRNGIVTGKVRTAFLAGLLLGAGHLFKESAFFFLLPMFLLTCLPPSRAGMKLMLTTGFGFALVVGSELLLYAATTGDPLYRYGVAAHVPRGTDGRRLFLELPSLLWNPAGLHFLYTGGFFLAALPAAFWIWRRRKEADLFPLTWLSAILLAINFWPLTVHPYQPALRYDHARVLAPVIAPVVAILAGALLAWGRRRQVTGFLAFTGLVGAALFSNALLHSDARRWHEGVHWAHERVTGLGDREVTTDHRTAEMLRFYSSYRPSFRLSELASDTPLPSRGSLLILNERMLNVAEVTGETGRPSWLNGSPPGTLVDELVLPSRRGLRAMLRGEAGEPERVSIRRIEGP